VLSNASGISSGRALLCGFVARLGKPRCHKALRRSAQSGDGENPRGAAYFNGAKKLPKKGVSF
jgi:hypothetical protein